MKIQRHPENSDVWMRVCPNNPITGRFWKLAEHTLGVHVEKVNGAYRANAGNYRDAEKLLSPEFDTPEECAQWLELLQAADGDHA